MDTGIKGRTALIAGASRNMGRYAALALAAEGVNLAICTSSRMKELNEVAEAARKLGVRVLAEQCDITDNASVEAFVKKARGEFGGVDIAVNVAGYRAESPLLEIGVEEWNRNIAVNLTGPFHVCRNVIPLMKERRWGRIINVLNIGAKAPRANSMPTSVSRAAGLAMTKALSQEFAPFNVLVNAMLVGLIEADQHVQAAKRQNIPLADYIKAREKDIPLGRIGKAEEFANLACFLVSDAGAYITGTATNVDGGRSPVV